MAPSSYRFPLGGPGSEGQRVAAQLMAQAEEYARGKGHRLMIVDTLSFQAPEFYKKQGFTEFGVINDFPAGHSHHYFEKRLTGLADRGNRGQ